MRIYEYKCEKKDCNTITEISLGFQEEIPKQVPCVKCGGKAYRLFRASVVIPEHFKATSSLYTGDHGANFDYLKGRLKHGTRLSGKEKVLF